MMECKFNKIELIKYAELKRRDSFAYAQDDSAMLIDNEKKNIIEQHLKSCPSCQEFFEAYQSLVVDLKNVKLKEKDEDFWAEMKASVFERLSEKEMKSTLLTKIKLWFASQKNIFVKILVTSSFVFFLISFYLSIQYKPNGNNLPFTNLSDSDIDMMLIYNGKYIESQNSVADKTEELDESPDLISPVSTDKNDSIISPEDEFYLELLNAKELIASL